MISDIKITSDYIKLDAFLKFAGIAETGGHAKILIQDGLIKIDGEICKIRGKKLYPGNIVEADGQSYQVVQSDI